MLLLLLACRQDPAPPPAVPAATVDHTVRASLAVRGVRPTVAELEAVARQPAALEALVRGWLDDPAFAESVRDQHAFHLGLRTANIGKVPPLGPVSGYDLGDLAHSLDEAPLYLIADIVTSGRPYAEVLTTADTMADPITAAVHGLAYDPSGPEWQRTPWTDGRPAAGILSDTAFNQRYMSSNTNFHRSRAAAGLATFLCQDLLAASTPTLFDPVGAEDAVREDPQCLACHQALDPAASAFWGLHPYILSSWVLESYRGGCPDDGFCYPLPFWDGAEKDDWQTHDLKEPAWGGEPVDGLAGLARAWTEDPAFDRCTARRFHAWHTGRHVDDVPDEVVAELTEVLRAHDGDVRELVVASVLHDDLVEAPRRLLRPEELARTVERLTGYRWEGDPDAVGGACVVGCYGMVDLARSDAHGFRTLLGGVDGWDVLEPADAPNPTHALATDWLAVEAAAHVVATDPTLPEPKLFVHVDPTGSAGPDKVRDQLAHLHAAILGELLPPDAAEVQRTEQLFRAVEAEEGPAGAWQAVVAAMLRDHRVVLP